MASLERALADYIRVLERSAAETRRAEDRPAYERHLAMAARMFAALHQPDGLAQLQALVAQEVRSFGRAYLADEPGRAAEAAFDAFARNTNIAPPPA
jgi:hypothetical protein